MPTIFEKIIAGEIPATIVHQDDLVTAFRDISPQAPVHVLIVPNKPIPTVNDVSEDDERMLGHLFIVARDIAKQEGIAENGFRLIINCNKHGGPANGAYAATRIAHGHWPTSRTLFPS